MRSHRFFPEFNRDEIPVGFDNSAGKRAPAIGRVPEAEFDPVLKKINEQTEGKHGENGAHSVQLRAERACAPAGTQPRVDSNPN